jgi:hypothetical protein
MVREALTVLALAVFVSGTLGAILYLGADALNGIPWISASLHSPIFFCR